MKRNSPFSNRIQKNLSKYKSWLKSNNIEAFRLYEKDIPEYPFIVDIYKNNAVIYEKGKRLDDTPENNQLRIDHIEDVIESINEVLKIAPENIHLKQRKVQKGTDQYTPLSKESTVINIQENSLLFEINLTDYLDTGLFLDHRPLRKDILKIKGIGKTFLNLFSYTSSVSVFAAKAGFETTSVDMSKTYIDWSKRNFKLNNFDLEAHHFINMNALDYLKSCRNEFDIIFLDPPSFSNSKKMENEFDVIRDQVDLIELTMSVLKPDGELYFSNNAKKFKIHDKITSKYKVEDRTEKSIPIDFRDKKIHCLFKITH